MPAHPPRYLPGRAFPPYTYAGAASGFPHPRLDPGGHSRGIPEIPPPALDPGRWQESADYLHGIDLFNHGYYWEAHEAWEGLWAAAGKRGLTSEFLKGLIKLTAAGVKARQGQAEGIRKHALQAERHFQAAARGVGKTRYAGLGFRDLLEFARAVAERSEFWPRHEGEKVAVVFDRSLEPG